MFHRPGGDPRARNSSASQAGNPGARSSSGLISDGAEPTRHGNAHPNIVPYETFEAKDGWLAIAAANDGLYERLCEVLGAPELKDD